MKVFLSWSGHKSHQVALVLQEWIPSVIQSITPYVSSENIDKGARWSNDIAKELEDSAFGILCVTRDNLDAPWLLFEAGALSKMVDKAFVCPFIIDLKSSELTGPLLQFQATIFEKEDLRKLMSTLNKCCLEVSLKEELLNKAFDIWWPVLEESLKKIKDDKTDKQIEPKKQSLNNEILEEILELTRVNQKLLRSPGLLFPPEYFDEIIRDRPDRNQSANILFDSEKVLLDIENNLIHLRAVVDQYASDNNIDSELSVTIRDSISFIIQRIYVIRKYNNDSLNKMTRTKFYRTPPSSTE